MATHFQKNKTFGTTSPWLLKVKWLVSIIVGAVLLIVSACGSDGGGSGPGFLIPVHIAVAADGSLVVVDPSLGAVVQVDPATGNRTILSR